MEDKLLGKVEVDNFGVKFSESRQQTRARTLSPYRRSSSLLLWAFGLSLAALVLLRSILPFKELKTFIFTERRIIQYKLDHLEIQGNFGGPAVDFSLNSCGKKALTGKLGVGIPGAVSPPSPTCDPGESDRCLEYGDYAKVYFTAPKVGNEYCGTVEWVSTYARRLEDCFDLTRGVHWYGGGGPTYNDTWPIETVNRREAPIVSGDSFGLPRLYTYGGVSENYWLLSSGVAIHVDEDVPLFFSMNSSHPNQACIVSEDRWPYKNRKQIRLKYNLCIGSPGENFKDVQRRALPRYYGRPSKTPDERMLVQPLWSTWAEYKTDVNQSLVLKLAERLVQEGLNMSSHIEIDDFWERCYGTMEFGSKFPNPAGMTKALRELGFRTTVWAHPFINYDCPLFETAFQLGFFVRDENSQVALTGWWNGKSAGLIDFTNEAAVTWWSARLHDLQKYSGIDSFKFDAGESNWLPYSHKFQGDVNNDPNLATTKYVQAVSKFGGLVEVRVGRQTQNESIFVRMLDKDSRWGYDNGLKSLIPTLLDFGVKGYSFVMPDMVGGNAYRGERPSKELFIRWLQLNTFMPCIQFSVLPWEYDNETTEIVREVLSIRFKYEEYILEAARQTVLDGSPMNRPLWWVDPLDPSTLTIDDEYMLGDEILAAPVTEEGAIARDIYLPKGQWVSGMEGGKVYDGPVQLSGFPAPLNVLPFFLRKK